MKAIRIVGNAGTGKTTTLLSLYSYLTNRPLSSLQRDIINEYFGDLNVPRGKEALMLTFSSTAAKELAKRLTGQEDTGYLTNIRTLHSFAASYLAQRRSIKFPTVNGRPGDTFVVFCRKFNIPFSTEEPFAPLLGNTIANMLSAAINRYYPEEKDIGIVLAKHILPRLQGKEQEVLLSYLEFKEKTGYWDYNDVLMALFDEEHIDLSSFGDEEIGYLIIDEAQDLSALQYSIISKIVQDNQDAIDLVVFAGDPHQTIYSFQAADPRFFMELDKLLGVDVETIVLKRSFRVPRTVSFASKQLLIRTRAVLNPSFLNYEPRPEIGEYRVIPFVDLVDGNTVSEAIKMSQVRKLIEEAGDELKRGKSVAILTRTNVQARFFEKLFILAGYSPKRLKASAASAADKLMFILAGVDYLQNGLEEGAVPKEVKEELFASPGWRANVKRFLRLTAFSRYLDNELIERMLLYSFKERGVNFDKMKFKGATLDHVQKNEKLRRLVEKNRPVIERFLENPMRFLSRKDVETYLRDKDYYDVLLVLLRTGRALTDSHLFIDTIHASKGAEFDVVYLYDSTRALPATESEKREAVFVLYVGMTRAREALRILDTENSLLGYFKREHSLYELGNASLVQHLAQVAT
ncbi:hypothetical protein A3L09_10615 (plasmid) [Thermococcus profundus]|uniref:DNA 3'-5' helicase n=1 Tax=Thermococcus profundus TaxID=49899 RepID=A0A2Z2ME00_THEPR|nr:ATP-dependent helicase [Thermococcus profundus]ASJ03803.1 hypothetical protein A3L09_10615 [Thermococcus profundus]